MINDISLESRFLDNERGSVGTKDHFLCSWSSKHKCNSGHPNVNFSRQN